MLMVRSVYEHGRPDLATNSLPKIAYYIRALGGFQVAANGQPINDFGSNKARALLFYLLMLPERAHSRTTLAELFWPERPTRSAFNNLSQALFMLRRAFERIEATPPLIISGRQTIQINPEATADFDVANFNQALATSRQLAQQQVEDNEAWLAALAKTVALYRGELLQGFSLPDAPDFDDWLAMQREHNYLAVLEALQQIFNSYTQRGDLNQTRHYGQQLLLLEPWNEAVHRALIVALIAAGKPHAALRQFELCRKTLADQLGLEPEEATVALIEPLQLTLHGSAQHNKQQHRRPTRSSLRLHVLPNEGVNCFIGRTAELVVCERFLSSNETLLSIVGPGGIGKSRLAHQVIRFAHGHFRDGVLALQLSGGTAATGLVAELAQALGLHEAASRPEVIAALAQRELLLLLDGFDPLRHSSDLLLAIQQQAPKLKLLVTTRQPLGLANEQCLRLGGLVNTYTHTSSGLESCEAIRLFVARSAEHGVQLSKHDLTTVAHICWQLDGIPRAIELAAALTATHSCSAIAELVVPVV